MARRKGTPSQVTLTSAAARLKDEYTREIPRAERLLSCLTQELASLLDGSRITLGVPTEARVKSWASIEEKITRKSLQINSILDLPDLVGVRLILLFRQDVPEAANMISNNLSVASVEDTAQRLSEAQFGYQSQHFVVQLKDDWLSVPRYSDLGGMKAEVQVRTLAQHTWAAASHKLQYKSGEGVPPPLQRTIYRVSALLETVDLELDRVLAERSEYLSSDFEKANESNKLNVELVRLIAKEILPEENGESGSGYDEVTRELEHFDVITTSALRKLLSETRDAVLEADMKQVRDGANSTIMPDRIARGVFYNHVGLIRQALITRFGEEKVRSVMETVHVHDDDDDLLP